MSWKIDLFGVQNIVIHELLLWSAFKHINQGSIFLDDYQISGYFDTNFIAVVLVEPILHKYEDLKIANILNLEEVYFLVTRIRYVLSPPRCDLAQIT